MLRMHLKNFNKKANNKFKILEINFNKHNLNGKEDLINKCKRNKNKSKILIDYIETNCRKYKIKEFNRLY